MRLLYSNDHWAFLIVRVGEWVPLIYDGLRLPAILDAASAFCLWLQEVWHLPQKLSPQWADSYTQHDSWSCGHRILVSWRYLLNTRLLQQPFATPLKEYLIPEDVLCRSSLQELSNVSLSGVLAKSEMSETSKPVADLRPKLELNSGIKAVSTSAKRERPSDDQQELRPVRPKMEVGPKMEVSVDGATSAAPSNGNPAICSAIAQVVSVQHDDASGEEDMVESDDPAIQPSQRELKRAEKRGKAICQLHDVTNLRWQNTHRSAKKQIKQGHWQRFLQHRGGIPSEEVTSCPECVTLLKETGEDRAEDMQLPDRYAIPNNGKTKRGRPKKGEERKMDWKAWLVQHRPNEYEIFTKDVVVKSRQKGTTKQEKDVPHLRCIRCGGEFRVQRDTNMIALHVHESSKMHQKSMGPEACLAPVPVPISHPCTGINLMDKDQTNPDSLCGQMRDGFLHWACLNCPDLTNNKATMSIEVRLTDQQGVILQDKQCQEKGHKIEGDKAACQRCKRLPDVLSLAQGVAKMLYRISLVDLMTLSMQNNRQAMKDFWQGVRKSPWCRFAPYDMDAEMADMSFQQLFRRCQQVVQGVDKSLRNAAFHAWVSNRMSWITPGSLPDPEVASSVENCAMELVNDKSVLDGKLAQMVKSGVLEADPAARVLVAALVQKADRVSRGLKRTGSSSVDGVDEHLLQQVLFRLYRGMSKKEALQTFGISKNAVSAKRMLQLDFLPSFFCPSADVLQSNSSSVLGHLRVLDTRHYALLWDDTAPRQNLTHLRLVSSWYILVQT